MVRTHIVQTLLARLGLLLALLAPFALADSAAAKPKPKRASPQSAAPTSQVEPEPSASQAPAQAESTPQQSPSDVDAPLAPPEPAGAPGAPTAAGGGEHGEPSQSVNNPAAPGLDRAQLTALRSQAAALIDEMTQARNKASLLGKTLFKTQLRLRVQNLAAPDPSLTKLVLKLDGAPVFLGDGASLRGDEAQQVFEGFITPGRHLLTAELRQESRQDSSFSYTLHDSYSFKAQRDKLSELTLIVDDDSDMASDYPDDGDGEYDVRLKLRVRTKDPGEE